MPARFPADYDYDYDYDYDRSGGSARNVLPLGEEFRPDIEEEPWPDLGAARFPRRYWDPALHALVVVAEFADTGWKDGPKSIDPGPPKLDPSVVEVEVNKLAAYGLDDRGAHLGEIIAQRANMAAYWANLLMFNQSSHPATVDVVSAALRVGQFAAMHFKHKYMRPRPSQISPRIFPIIVVPGHPSYPSGHATEGMLLSLCLSELVPAASRPLLALAERVAINRERAGVHYPSDTQAGFKLAQGCFERLQSCKTFLEVMDAAKREWQPAS